jgi:hypothetical protein
MGAAERGRGHVSFQSFMTGELFQLLSERSVLRHSVAAAEIDSDDLRRRRVEMPCPSPSGWRKGCSRSAPRTCWPDCRPRPARARLSGLLIGAELAGARPFWLGQDVAVAGAPALAAALCRRPRRARRSRPHAGRRPTDPARPRPGLADAEGDRRMTLRRALGTCYYPEHWPEEIWAEDARRMAEAGLTWVRIGEFAWSRLEPAPGRFDWGWMDRAFETLAAAGLRIVLGTPTATPPRWMLDRHPDMLACRRRGPAAPLRLAPALLLFPCGLPGRGRAHRRGPGDPLRPPPRARRLADGQRIRLPRHRAQLLPRRPRRLPRLARADATSRPTR